tara:strand:- start:5305 stop:6441 length:1137 start_codon:yes stop_codon:yes gene_type:complete
MSSNFEYRYVKITPEHTAGTGVKSYGTASAMTHATGSSATAVNMFGEVDDESIAYQFDLMTRMDVSRYGSAKSVNGKEYSEGGVNLVMQPDDFLGYLLYGIYGDTFTAAGQATTAASTPASTGYSVSGFVHSWYEVAELILPSFTLEVGREEKEHTYKGMCMQTLSISAAHGEYATIAASFTGKSESAVSTLVAAPVFVGAAVDGFHFAEGTVNFSSAGASQTEVSTVKSVSLEYNMNLDTDMACSIGDRTYLRQPQPQRREITGSIEFSLPQTSSADGNTPDYETALATGGKIFDGDAAEPAISLKFLNADSQALEFHIRKVRWEAPSANISGRDTQTLSMNFVALVDATDNVMSKTILTLDAATSELSTGIKYSAV